jgi:hypothetical protein
MKLFIAKRNSDKNWNIEGKWEFFHNDHGTLIVGSGTASEKTLVNLKKYKNVYYAELYNELGNIECDDNGVIKINGLLLAKNVWKNDEHNEQFKLKLFENFLESIGNDEQILQIYTEGHGEVTVGDNRILCFGKNDGDLYVLYGLEKVEDIAITTNIPVPDGFKSNRPVTIKYDVNLDDGASISFGNADENMIRKVNGNVVSPFTTISKINGESIYTQNKK